MISVRQKRKETYSKNVAHSETAVAHTAKFRGFGQTLLVSACAMLIDVIHQLSMLS